VSVTRGVVSRIEPIQYAHGAVHLLGVQIDASINPGNSGGPALSDEPADEDAEELEVGASTDAPSTEEAEQGDDAEDGKAASGSGGGRVVGVAFQALAGADNIGYLIPAPVMRHFLTQWHLHKRYSGFPQLGLQYQTLENTSLRRALQLSARDTGVLVTRLAPVSPASTVLRGGDVLLALDGHAIANNGTVAFRYGQRLYLNYLLGRKFVGDQCQADVLRNGERLRVSFALLSSAELALVPVKPLGAPSYLVYGGLVFTRLTLPYLQEFASSGDEDGSGSSASWYDAGPRALVHIATTQLRQSLDEEVVILSHVLPDDLTAGYAHLSNLELKRFNNQPVRNLRQLALMLRDAGNSGDGFARFTLADELTIALDQKLVEQRTPDILDAYAVPAPNSGDLDE